MKELFVSEEVRLTEISMDDAESIFATIDSQRQYLGRWLPFVPYTRTVEDSRAFVRSVLEIPQQRREVTFSLKINGGFGGLAGFKGTDHANHRTEIGYWLSENFQGKGIMTRCVKSLCDYAFDEMGMNRVQIKCAVGNTPSSNIPKRLGFRFEGIERDGEYVSDGQYFDIEVYSLLKRERE